MCMLKSKLGVMCEIFMIRSLRKYKLKNYSNNRRKKQNKNISFWGMTMSTFPCWLAPPSMCLSFDFIFGLDFSSRRWIF